MSDIQEPLPPAEPEAEDDPGDMYPETSPPLIRKKRGRPKGWKKQPIDFKPREEPAAEVDTESILKKELAYLRGKVRELETGKRAEKMFGLPPQPPQPESPAFKGRPLPSPLPKGFPEIDPLSGDKTPAVVEWFRDNDPDEFAERYKGRKTHLRATLHQESDEDDKPLKVKISRGSDPTLNTSARTYGG